MDKNGDWVYQEDTDLWNSLAGMTEIGTPSDQIDTFVRLSFPADLPAGEYELHLLIYDSETLQPAVQIGIWEPEFLLARVRLH